jgi:hypothetical protein
MFVSDWPRCKFAARWQQARAMAEDASLTDVERAAA